MRRIKLVTQVRIISLGEIVTPDIMKTIQSFTDLIAGEKQAAVPTDIGKAIGVVIQQNMILINDFKLGKLNEKYFTDQMIDALEKATDIRITVEEFDHAWKAMSPQFKQFESQLKQAIEYNSNPNQQIIFISFTNPKDMRYLIDELKTNNQDCKIFNDQLTEIGGIPLYTTYSTQQTKAELIETTIKQLKSKAYSQRSLGSSISNVLSIKDEDTKEESGSCEIKYIRCVNSIKDPILREDLDMTNQDVGNKTALFLVDTLLWKKWEQPLSDILSNNQIAARQISVSKL